MTDPTPSSSAPAEPPAPPESRAVVAAFADGEAVDAVALDRALAEADGRAYLIDLLALRDLVTVVPGGARTPAPPDVAPSPRRWWSVAAAIAVVSVLGGYAAGRFAPFDRSTPLGDSAAAPAVVAPAAAGTLDAPEPTNVIRLEPGVDWQETGAGGNQ